MGSVDDLVAHLASGEKPRARWRVGTEHEKIGLYADTLRRVPFEGERGIEGCSSAIAELDGWSAGREDGRADRAREGRREHHARAGRPARALRRAARAHPRDLRASSARTSSSSAASRSRWASSGSRSAWIRCTGSPRRPRMPKARYDIMREYLPTRGELSMHMMHLTATVQANFDYANEADMVAKCRMALGATPIVSAIFANSSLYEGKPVRLRLAAPPHLALHRSRSLGHPALRVRGGLRLPALGRVGARRADVLRRARRPLPAGARHHLPPLPPRRLRGRARDDRRLRPPPDDALPGRAAEADPRGARRRRRAARPDLRAARPLEGAPLRPRARCAAAGALTAGWSQEEREAAMESVARRGLAARIAGRPALELGRELVAIAGEGLRADRAAGRRSPTSAGSSIRSAPSSSSARARARSSSSAGKASGTAMWNA